MKSGLCAKGRCRKENRPTESSIGRLSPLVPRLNASTGASKETGYEVTSLKFLSTIICTPGYCEERIHLYYAELSDTANAQDLDPDENVFPVVLSEAEVEDGIRNGTIFDSKTLSAWLCWKLAR